MSKILPVAAAILFLFFSIGIQSQNKIHTGSVHTIAKTNHRSTPSNEGFAFNNIAAGTGNFIKFSLTSTAAQTVIAPVTGHTFYGADFNAFNDLYAIDAVSGNSSLYKIDTASGNMTLIGSSVIASGHKITGITYDSTDNKWYAASTDGTSSTLYIINIATGGLIFVGSIQGMHSVVGISAAPNGTLFGLDNASDSLIKINKFTAVPSGVGAIGIEIATNIGMDFNNGSGILYVTFNTPTPQLMMVDTASGNGTISGNITGTVQVTGLAIPFSGTVAPPPPSDLCQSFSDQTFPPAGWNLSSGNKYWQWNMESAFCLGNGSAEYDFYDAQAGTTEDLISAVFGAVNGTTDSLVIHEAYATYQGEVDQLVIKTSTDTGSVWTTLITLDGGNSGPLVTAPGTTDPFLPGCTQWQRLAFGLPSGTKRVQFEAVSAYGNNLYLDSICIAGSPIGIHPVISNIPSAFMLHQNYPNPFNPETKITFDISTSVNVKLTIYNILGEEIQVLANKQMTPGSYNYNWNGSSFPSGIYFYRLDAGSYSNTKKMMLIK